MKQYRLVDNILGWVAFVIAAYTYCSTIEICQQYHRSGQDGKHDECAS